MKPNLDSLVRQLVGGDAANAVKMLLEYKPPTTTLVAAMLPSSFRREVLKTASRLLTEGDSSEELRYKIVWLLREMECEGTSGSAATLSAVLIQEDAPDSLRALVLDTMEHLWLAGHLSNPDFLGHVRSLRCSPGTMLWKRWLSVLRDIDSDWVLARLAEEYGSSHDNEVLEALTRSVASGAADMLRGLLLATNDSDEGARVRQALEIREVADAKRTILAGFPALTRETVGLLVQRREYAALYKALGCGLVSPRDIPPLDTAPEGLRKSQRKFFRMLLDQQKRG